MQTGQQGCAVGGIGLIEQHPRVERLGLEHAGGALRRGNVLRRAAGQPGIALRPVRSLCNGHIEQYRTGTLADVCRTRFFDFG